MTLAAAHARLTRVNEELLRGIWQVSVEFGHVIRHTSRGRRKGVEGEEEVNRSSMIYFWGGDGDNAEVLFRGKEGMGSRGSLV